MIRKQLEGGAGGLAQLDAEAAARRAAEDAELERIREQFPDLWERYAPAARLPERLQATDPPLQWTTHSAGRGPGLAEVAMPPRSPPPMLMAEGRLTTTDPRGFAPAPPAPAKTTWDVTPAPTGSSPLDQRLRAERAEHEREIAELKARLVALERGEAAPVVAAAPAAEPEPTGPVITVEQMREMWRSSAYQAAKRSSANADGSGWVRSGY